MLAIVPRDADAETFALALNSVAMGMMFYPRDCLTPTTCGSQNIKALSSRQREILTMLAAGESNKQIGRLLNISTGTVKAHLESLYQRLEVKPYPCGNDVKRSTLINAYFTVRSSLAVKYEQATFLMRKTGLSPR